MSSADCNGTRLLQRRLASVLPWQLVLGHRTRISARFQSGASSIACFSAES